MGLGGFFRGVGKAVAKAPVAGAKSIGGGVAKAVVAAKEKAFILAARVAVHEVETDEEYGPMYKKIHDALNGKKLLIGTILATLPSLVQIVQQNLAAGGYSAVAAKAGLVIAAVGSVHKAVKFLIAIGVINDADGDLTTAE